jgi:catechol 2,3-dioxygenase-like lactoylglutathione lyase family enzyme
MRFARFVLQAPNAKLADLTAFYSAVLGARTDREDEQLRIGETELVFEGAAGSPFYHFALLVPGDRFDAALQWAYAHVELLPDSQSGELVFDFQNWEAQAVYFHDPAGNIVELIAHTGVGEGRGSGTFEPTELLGLSEIGLIGDSAELVRDLQAVGLRLWDGVLSPGRLAFLGERTRTLIVAEPGRGWLPTGRPAEAHRVDVIITGMPAADVTVGGHRIRCRTAEPSL